MEPGEAWLLRQDDRIRLRPPQYGDPRLPIHDRIYTVKRVTGAREDPNIETNETMEFQCWVIERVANLG